MTKQSATVVSIHIPKVGGTSFKQNLIDNYGEDNCLFVYDQASAEAVNDGSAFRTSAPPQVVHGHLRPGSGIRSLAQPFLVVWLRNPVDRLISLYNFWLLLDPSGNPVHDAFLRERPTLVEFSQGEVRTEVLSYFAEFNLDEYDFVGITEFYDEDVADLGRRLGWRNVGTYHDNVTPPSNTTVSEAERAEVAAVLADSVDLYQQALSNRSQRLAPR